MYTLNSHMWLVASPPICVYGTTQIQNIFIISEDITELDMGFKPHCKIHHSMLSLNLTARLHHSGISQRRRVYVLLIMVNRDTFQS